MSFTLAEIVDRLGGELAGGGSLSIRRIASLGDAQEGDLAFLANPRYKAKLRDTRATAVIVSPESAAECPVPAIVTPRPYLYFARAAQLLNPPLRPVAGIHSSAVVETVVPPSVSIGANVHVGPGAIIGEWVVIEANCSIGAACRIGAGSWLHAGATVYDRCQIGERVIVHSGAVIGADGFGFARDDDGSWVKIPQTGRVIVGNDVEIGANTTIDRGAIEDTVIEDGVKLDNLIQIGHNVRIGRHTAIAGCVGVAGSAKIGERCTVGGAAMILGHLTIPDGTNISSGTMVTKSLARPGTYTGNIPCLEHGDWLRNFARLRHLDDMADRIRTLETRLAELEKKA